MSDSHRTHSNETFRRRGQGEQLCLLLPLSIAPRTPHTAEVLVMNTLLHVSLTRSRLRRAC